MAPTNKPFSTLAQKYYLEFSQMLQNYDTSWKTLNQKNQHEDVSENTTPEGLEQREDVNNLNIEKQRKLTKLERTKCNNAEDIMATNEPNRTNIAESSGDDPEAARSYNIAPMKGKTPDIRLTFKCIGYDTKGARRYIIAPTKGTTRPRVADKTPETHATNMTSNSPTFKCSGQDATATNSQNNNVATTSGVEDIAPDNRRGYSSGYDVPAIQTFRPTWEEFKDFNAYIKTIEETGAHKAGVCKIIPPSEWVPRKSGYDVKKMNITIPRPIEQIAAGDNGIYTQYSLPRKKMSLTDFQELSNTRQYRTPPHKDFADLERVYWENITKTAPIYGADVSASITDPKCTAWNINRLDSVLDYLEKDSDISIEGVNSAYLYFGMWRSTFAWHTEDMDLYSINYLHFGAPKTWYSIPPKHARRFEEFAAKYLGEVNNNCPGYLRHKSIMISPKVLKENAIPYDVITQEAGEIMITFPLGYHAGFNHGFNCAESTNFATERWIDYGKHVIHCTCNDDMVKINMSNFVNRFQPEQYQSWTEGNIGPHPEEPFETINHTPTTDATSSTKVARKRRGRPPKNIGIKNAKIPKLIN